MIKPLPSVIKVGIHQYEVRVVTPSLISGYQGTHAAYPRHLIELSNELDDIAQEEVLLHELMHAAMNLSGVKCTDEVEALIASCDGPLFMLLKENGFLEFRK